MSQLITTSKIHADSFLCKEQDIQSSYSLAYEKLKNILDDKVVFFAFPTIKSEHDISWSTELEGKIYSFNSAKEEINNPESLLQEQVNQLYFKVLEKARTKEQKYELINFLDRCLSIVSKDDIFLIIDSEGNKQFCITNWGTSKDGQPNILAQVVSVKKINITIRVLKNGQPVPNKPLWVRLSEQNVPRKVISDDNGQIFLKDLDLMSMIVVEQREGDHRVQVKSFLLDRTTFDFNLAQSDIINVKIKAISPDNKPVANLRLEVEVDDQTKQYTTDDNGEIDLGALPTNKQIQIRQILSPSKKRIKNFNLKDYPDGIIEFKVEQLDSNYLIIKVLDAKGKPFPNAELEISYGKNTLILKANDKGLVVVNDLPFGSEIIIRQIVDGVTRFQKKIEYTPEQHEVEFISHLEHKQYKKVKIKVQDYSGRPIKNLSVTLYNGALWSSAVTDDNGIVRFEKIDPDLSTKLKIIYKNHSYEQSLNLNEKTDYTITLGSGQTWLIRIILILLAAFILAGIVFLVKNVNWKLHINWHKIHIKSEKFETLPSQKKVTNLPPPKPKFHKYTAKILVMDMFQVQPIISESIALYRDSTLLTKTDSARFNLLITSDTPHTYIFQAQNYLSDTLNFVPSASDTVFLIPKNVFVARDTSCGSYISSHYQRYYIQTVRFPQSIKSFKLLFVKRYVSDKVRIFIGDKHHLAQNKIVWNHQTYMPDTIRKVINLPYAADKVTILIQAGEQTVPSWRFKIYCK